MAGYYAVLAVLLLECIISKLATGEISIFKLVSEAEETGFSIALSEIPDRFCNVKAHL